MAKKMMASSIWIMTLAVLALVASIVKADVQCNDVISKVMPCQDFLIGSNAAPSTECCNGLQYLDKDAAASQPDRKAMCECLKNAAKNFPINLDKANQLPQLCNLTFKIVIDPNVNCNNV